jgi:hypothetical protein
LVRLEVEAADPAAEQRQRIVGVAGVAGVAGGQRSLALATDRQNPTAYFAASLLAPQRVRRRTTLLDFTLLD